MPNESNGNHVNNSQCSGTGWSTRDNLNYTCTLLTNFDKTISATKICDTSGADYRLTAVVTQNKELECNSSYCDFTSILIVQLIGNDRVPFSVSCSIDNETLTAASMNFVRNMTTHHRFIGRLTQ
jgi:hypothetical protein